MGQAEYATRRQLDELVRAGCKAYPGAQPDRILSTARLIIGLLTIGTERTENQAAEAVLSLFEELAQNPTPLKVSRTSDSVPPFRAALPEEVDKVGAKSPRD